MASLAVSQVGLPVAARLKTSLDVSAHMLAMEAHHYNLPIEQYYRRVGEHLGVECPSVRGEVKESNAANSLDSTRDYQSKASPKGRKTSRRALRCNSKEKMNWIVTGDDSKLPQPSFSDKTGEKPLSGNGRQNYSTIGRSSANVSIGSSEEKTHLQKPAVDKAVIPSLTPPFDLFSVEVMPRRARTVDDAAIDAEVIPLRERVLDALSRLEQMDIEG